MPNLTHTSEQRLSTRAHASPVPDAQTCTALVKISQRLVDQVIQLLETSVTRDDQLAFQSDLIPGSSIGKHLRYAPPLPVLSPKRAWAADHRHSRHTLDHFRLLLQSLDHDDGDSSPLPLCYDTRSRNVTSETSVSAALQSFQTLQTQLKRAESVPSGRRIKLEAVTPTVVEVESTFGREVRATRLS